MTIKPGKLPKPANLPLPKAPDENVRVRFSFRHLDLFSNPKFCLEKCDDGYLEKFLCRLRDLSQLTINEFRTNKSRALRIHPIDWVETSEPGGFTTLNAQTRSEEAWQFEITKGEHGRVHGILIDEVFYVIWVDPDHLLYS